MSRDAGNRFSDARDLRLSGGTVTIRDSLAEFDKLDFYQIRLTGRSNFRCTLDGLDGNADLALYDRKGKELASSSEDGNDSETINRRLKAGTYFVRVNRIEGDTNYRIRFSTEQGPGGSFGKSYKIRPNGNNRQGRSDFSDSLGNGNDSDFYRFELGSRSRTTTILEGLRNNADITLYNSRRQRIGGSSRGGNLSELVNTILNAGVYFIRVNLRNGSNGNSNNNTLYKLRFSFTSLTINLGDNNTNNAEPVPTGSTTTPTTTPFNDFVGASDPEDFYRVNLTTPSNLNLALNGLKADANLELLNSSGSVIGNSSNTGTAQDLINQNLAAGTYFVRVFPATSGASTDYTLNFTSSPLRVFGLTDNNSLAAFNADQPTKAVTLGITGLASGETLRGIDFRPSTGQLFGLSSASKLYTIDLATGAATAVSSTPLSPTFTGTSYGFDFNPTVDRIRVVSDADENLRLNPITGTVVDADPLTAGTQFDQALAYASGDTSFGNNPNVTAVAYTNSSASATTTTLFGIDTVLDRLVRQGSQDGTPISPNTGSLSTIGALGVDFGPNSGFDIFTDSSQGNVAYATSGSALYSINLTTGVATSLGTVSAGTTAVNLVGLAVRA